MMRILLLVFTASAAKVSPVQKVIELLDDLKGKVQGDLAAEETMMGEYSKWCDEESNEKEDAITSGKRTINDLAASINDADASIAELSSEIEDLAGKISSAEQELSAATGIRENENKDFTATEGELSDTIDSLTRASAVLSRGQSFLQKGQNGDLSKLTSSLEAIIEANWVNSDQKAKVQALLQTQDQDGDEDLSLQPQATAAAFTSQGGGILDTLKDMREKAEGTLTDARKEEMKAQHAYAMLKQSLETELKQMKKRMGDASVQKASTEEARNAAQEKKTSTEKTVAADEAYLKELNQSCSAKAAEWAQRQKTAAEEVATIEKAKEILADGVKAFLQVSSKTHLHSRDSRRDQVVDVLRKLSREHRGYALSQLAVRATSDTFGKVKGLIENMITRLETEAAQEADAKSFCDTETSKSNAKQADLTAKMDMHNVRIEKATANIDELKVQSKKLQEEIAEMDATQAEATSLRQEEHAAYLKASKDYKDSATAVANAMQVLQDYYASGSFVQVSQAPEFGGAKTDVAGTIVSMLEVAESDFSRLLAESEAEESAAKEAYDKLVQDNAVSRAAKQTEVKGNENEVKHLNASLLNYKEDHATTGKELDSVLAYLDKLKPQCETKVMSYAERKAKREQEVEGLKEALSILEG
jgi:chromosome segregation ATPase